jgi:GNAT superfamily N-acetyltransferase
MDVGARDNLWPLFEALGGLPEAEIGSTGGARWHHAPYDNPMFCGVWDAIDTASALDALDILVGRGAPYVFVWLAHGAHPAGLEEALAERGAVPFEIDAPTMVADLGDRDWSALQRAPEALTIEALCNGHHLDAFAATFAEGLGVPEWAGRSWAEMFRRHGPASSPIRPYPGFLDGRPVATNMLFCGGGAASVFGVATVPDARGQGIGAAITLAPYRDALEAGWRHAVIFATELGAPVYRRIGFTDTGSSISRYIWARP